MIGRLITLKAFANSSPGRGPRADSPRGVGAFALKPCAKESEGILRNSEGVATVLLGEARRNSFRVASSKLKCVSQGCSRATLGWN